MGRSEPNAQILTRKVECEQPIAQAPWKSFSLAKSWGKHCGDFFVRRRLPRRKSAFAKLIVCGLQNMPMRPKRIFSMTNLRVKCSKACREIICLMRVAARAPEFAT